MYSIICLSSFGSKLDLWSGPFIFLLKVKCFSMTEAPIATALLGAIKLKLWSDNPTLILNFFLNNNKVFKFKSCNGVGYAELHCNKIKFFFPIILIALLTSKNLMHQTKELYFYY